MHLSRLTGGIQAVGLCAWGNGTGASCTPTCRKEGRRSRADIIEPSHVVLSSSPRCMDRGRRARRVQHGAFCTGLATVSRIQEQVSFLAFGILVHALDPCPVKTRFSS
ncbi:hypothetical protein K466DRAFT_183083 [Polyporus arcularius HHB13444]|uniref:Uncharacterized protein n=1 Tax=Polyporus arcularius HHB13444 TaxID=1314778 RepID=A0A5C3P8K8_9APHY|nr:hypothetical protein K466DRAFT_183083 [Polyporus arcularius HHB13444]